MNQAAEGVVVHRDPKVTKAHKARRVHRELKALRVAAAVEVAVESPKSREASSHPDRVLSVVK